MRPIETSACSQTCRRKQPSITIIRKIANDHDNDDVKESKLAYKPIRENHYDKMQRVKHHTSVI